MNAKKSYIPKWQNIKKNRVVDLYYDSDVLEKW